MQYIIAMVGICLLGNILIRRIPGRRPRAVFAMLVMLAGFLCIGMYMYA